MRLLHLVLGQRQIYNRVSRLLCLQGVTPVPDSTFRTLQPPHLTKPNPKFNTIPITIAIFRLGLKMPSSLIPQIRHATGQKKPIVVPQIISSSAPLLSSPTSIPPPLILMRNSQRSGPILKCELLLFRRCILAGNNSERRMPNSSSIGKAIKRVSGI